MKKHSIVPVVKKSKLTDKKQDASFWRSRPPAERLEALEEIRQEYHGWQQDTQPRMQKTYSIIKRQLEE